MNDSKIEIKSAYNDDIYKTIKILEVRYYDAFIYRKELISDGGFIIDLGVCYSKNNGEYIGDLEDAKFLCHKKGITHFEKCIPTSTVCSIGFNPKEKKWYGWSHIAIFGYGIGSKYKKTEWLATSLEDAKQMAMDFAESVS